jgi:predicted nucleotidyltransferase
MPASINDLSLTNDKLTAIQAADRQLKKLFPVEQVVLFGSVARGEAVEGSDIDLLIITSKEVNYHTRISSIL